MNIPVVMTIAGSDCSAGAGLQADLKTFQHFHVHGLTAVTCIVSETANVVRNIMPVPVELLADQIELLLESFSISAIKTGMLYSADHVDIVASILTKYPGIPLIVDPVMVASTGDLLIHQAAVRAYMEKLLPLASLVTPNIPEAETLLDMRISNLSEMEMGCKEFTQRFQVPVLIKGGHLEWPECIDMLHSAGQLHKFSAPRLETAASHGTGCTLSAAISALIGSGHTLLDAVAAAKSYLNRSLRDSYSIQLEGKMPMHCLNQGTTFSKNEA